MSLRLTRWCSIVALLLLESMTAGPGFARSEGADTEFVRNALAAELAGVQDLQHPMRYQLRKSSSRLATTKNICETRDGAVARLIEINDRPLAAADEQKEQARLDALLSDPGKQKHRKQAEDDDTSRVLKVVRALPDAFVYEYIGAVDTPSGKVQKFAFRPNPSFDPPDLETHALTEMTGEVWIDAAQDRVTHLEGHLRQDVDFGWGILGRLNKGGWLVIEQAGVANHQWRIVHFQMVMSGRVLFKTKNFDTQEDESHFVPVPAGITYAQAILMLRDNPVNSTAAK
jgi:hypothetical protein